MVVQVGDKVLVYGAGTPGAFAKKIEPVEVGDKVDVLTLSDGTKLAMPKIELDLSEYVWVVPEFDTPFNIGDVPFQWGMMPLGAAVFTITEKSCYYVGDEYREWEEGELSGFYLINLSMIARLRNPNLFPVPYTDPDDIMALNTFVIENNTQSKYTLRRLEEILPPRDLSFELGTNIWEILHPNDNYVPPTLNGSFYIYQTLDYWWWWNWWSGVQQRCNCAGAHTLSFKIRGLCYWGLGASTPRVEFYWQGIGETNQLGLNFGDNLMTGQAGIFVYDTDPLSEFYGLHRNASYPGFDTITINLASKIPGWNPDAHHYDTIFKVIVHTGSNSQKRHFTEVEVDDVHLDGVRENCTTGGIVVGDKYVIYNPVTKRLVFNDATKLLTSANWQTGGEGAEISSSPIEYVWDGQGYVYLTSSKTTFSMIQYDDLLQVQAVHGETIRTIPMHLGERIAQGGETVSRELTNITSILRSGKNTITLTAKNQDGTKVGFVTAVYVKRNMTTVSL